MRRFTVRAAFAAVAACALGCGNGSAPERTATKVLSPEEAKITLGKTAESSPAPAAAAPVENESKAPPAAPAAETKP